MRSSSTSPSSIAPGGQAGAADRDGLVSRLERRGDLLGQRRLGEPGVALDAVERVAEDDLRDRAPDIGERGPGLVLAQRRVRHPGQHRLVAGDITLSVRLWKRPQVKEGNRYRVGPGLIKVDAIELVPFAAITEADVRLAGEPGRETLRDRAAHAGPIDEDTLVYRIELHAVSREE